MKTNARRLTSPEGSRVWLLIVACSAIGLLFAGFTVSKSGSVRSFFSRGRHLPS
jgi:hypothetical protein